MIVDLDEVMGPLDTGAPVLSMSLRDKMQRPKIFYAARPYLATLWLAPTQRASRFRIVDRLGYLGLAASCGPGGRREGRSKNFDSLRNLPSLSVYALAPWSLISSSPRRLLLWGGWFGRLPSWISV